jgi:ketosteroid isomerase-like protein
MTRPQITASDLAALFEALNRHDIEAAMVYFARDCVSTAASEPGVDDTRIKGIEAIAAELSGVWDEIKDAHWDHQSHIVYGDRAASEWTFSGTNASGNRIEADGCDLLLLDKGKIVRKHAFRKDRLRSHLVGHGLGEQTPALREAAH